MVKPRYRCRNRAEQRGLVMYELIVAIGILSAVVFPLAGTHLYEVKAVRAGYLRAVAMEIVDGELEVLAAGEWRAFGQGQHDYTARAAAATNLPSGKLTLRVKDRHLRLEWRPAKRRGGGIVLRETEGR